MTLQDLRYVVALMDHGHFGRAAVACDISQSTLSTQIKKLEQQLGVTLFERTTQSVSVTPIGAEIAARARQVLAEIETIATLGQRQSGPLAGRFNLGVIPTLGPYLLPWLVPALKTTCSELRLMVCEDLTVPLLNRLRSHRLDAALVALPASDPRLDTLALFDEPFWLAEPGGSKRQAAKAITADELHGRRLLLLTEGNCLRDQAREICGTVDQNDETDFRATSLETILQMVATGLGSTLVPAMACSELRARAIAMRPLEAGVGRRIGLVWRRNYARLADIHLLTQIVLEHLPPCVNRARPPPVD